MEEEMKRIFFSVNHFGITYFSEGLFKSEKHFKNTWGFRRPRIFKVENGGEKGTFNPTFSQIIESGWGQKEKKLQEDINESPEEFDPTLFDTPSYRRIKNSFSVQYKEWKKRNFESFCNKWWNGFC